MWVGKFCNNSSMKGARSCVCNTTNFRLHFCEIFKNVSHAMSRTPGWSSCMNSKFLFTTVFKNFQWALKKRGYCPTTYMMLLAMMALLSLPRLFSHNPNKSLMTVTKNRFSSSSFIAPDMDPMAQHKVFKLRHVHWLPSTCASNFSNLANKTREKRERERQNRKRKRRRNNTMRKKIKFGDKKDRKRPAVVTVFAHQTIDHKHFPSTYMIDSVSS